ncbi:unnamed protein product [Caretta caretta]
MKAWYAALKGTSDACPETPVPKAACWTCLLTAPSEKALDGPKLATVLRVGCYSQAPGALPGPRYQECQPEAPLHVNTFLKVGL